MGSMNMMVVTRQNIKEIAKLTGRSEQELLAQLQQAYTKRTQFWVQVPLPKHLRGA